jgi:hypothetical protein
VTALSGELLGKAKIQLAASVGGGEKLIDSTIKTTVTEKKFTEELDQQAKELHGSVTVTIAGMSYSQHDIAALLQDSINEKVPSGYKVESDTPDANVGDVTMKKDGTAVVSATLKENAIPIIDTASVRTMLAGKNISQAQETLKALPGVAGVEINFHRSLWKTALPKRAQNITVLTTIQE